MHIFGLCDEAGVPRENPHIHMNMGEHEDWLGFKARTLLLLLINMLSNRTFYY